MKTKSDVCEQCGSEEGQPHDDKKHGSGRYGVGGDLELKGKELESFLKS